MMRKLIVVLVMLYQVSAMGQEIVFDHRGDLEQVYLDAIEAEELLPMNDLGIEFGYVLYQTEIIAEPERVELVLEHVRDYAVVYIDGILQGTLTDRRKNLTVEISDGKHLLQLYVENIGRITYGPEILDNSKGLFGAITLNGRDVEIWKMIPLHIKEVDVNRLTFEKSEGVQFPAFRRGTFDINPSQNMYLDISGWGMGEVWINNKYLGSYWEEEKQQSIHISQSDLVQGKNEIVVFELKNNDQNRMRLSEIPVFR